LVSLRCISERLAHENVETTLETYAHLYPNKHGEVAEKLDALNEPLEGEKLSEEISELEKKIKNLEE